MKEAVAAHLSSWCLQCLSSFFVAQGGFYLCTLSFVCKHAHLDTVSVCLAWSSPPSRYCHCVAYLLLWQSGYLMFLNILSETGN